MLKHYTESLKSQAIHCFLFLPPLPTFFLGPTPSPFTFTVEHYASVQMNNGNVSPSILTHGLYHVLHLSCEETVSHMTCGEGAAGFASLHSSGHVQFYYPDGRLRDPSFCQSLTIRYAGLTSTHLPGRLVGWGPGAVLTVLDAELKPLVHAVEPMDVRMCKVWL